MTFSPLRNVRHGGRGSHGVLSELSLDGKDSSEAAALIWERLQIYVKLESTRFLEIFREFDKDRSGAIDAGEFEKALRRIGVVGASPKAVQAVIDTADPNGDGVLEYKELLRALRDFKFRGELPSAAAATTAEAQAPLRTVDQIIAELQLTAETPEIWVQDSQTPNDSRSSTPLQRQILAAGEKPKPTWVSKGVLPPEQRQPPYSPDGPFAKSHAPNSSATLDKASPDESNLSNSEPSDASMHRGTSSTPTSQLPISTSIDPYSGYPMRTESSNKAAARSAPVGPVSVQISNNAAGSASSESATQAKDQSQDTHRASPPKPSLLLLNEPGPYCTQHNPRAGLFVGPLVTTRELLLLTVERDPLALLYFSDQVRADREFVLAAVARGGSLLEYAPPLLQGDREVCLTAVLHDGRALEFVSPPLRDDKALVLMAVENNGFALGYSSPNLRNDHDVCLAAVSRDPMALEFASPHRRADIKVVLAAVRLQGEALQFADPSLQATPSVVSVAVAQNGIALNHARLRAIDSVVHGQSAGDALKWRGTVLLAVAQDGHALWAAPELLQDDREVVLTAVAQNGLALKWASKRLRSDPEVIQVATAQSSASVVFAADEWWSHHVASGGEEHKDGSSKSSSVHLALQHASEHAVAPPHQVPSQQLREERENMGQGTRQGNAANFQLASYRPRHEPISCSPVRSRGPAQQNQNHEPSSYRTTRSNNVNNGINRSHSSPTSRASHARSSSRRGDGLTRGAAYEQAWEALRIKQFGPPSLLPDQPKRVPPMKMWSHEFNYSDRFQAAALEDYDELPTSPDHALPPSNSTAAAITATASCDAPSSGHSHEVPHKNNGSCIMQDGVLAAIVELSRRTPRQPPFLRADAWRTSQLPDGATCDQGNSESSPLRTQGHFLARYGPCEGAVRWELAGPMATGARQEVEEALRDALALDAANFAVEEESTSLDVIRTATNSIEMENIAAPSVIPVVNHDSENIATADATTIPTPEAASRAKLEVPVSTGISSALKDQAPPIKLHETIREKKARLARERAVGAAMSHS